LDRALPVKLNDKDSYLNFGKGVSVAMICLCCDGASSNLAALSRMLYTVESLPPEGDCVLLLGQRCLTHMMHIAKCSVLSVNGIATHLFSISKVVRHSRSLEGL